LYAESKTCNAEAECVAELTLKLQSLQGDMHPEPAAEPAPGAKKVDLPLEGQASTGELNPEACLKETPRTYNNRINMRPRGGRGGRS
jgi:hypothetical protein